MSLCKYYDRDEEIFRENILSESSGYQPEKIQKRRCDLFCKYMAYGEAMWDEKFIWCRHPQNYHIMEVLQERKPPTSFF